MSTNIAPLKSFSRVLACVAIHSPKHRYYLFHPEIVHRTKK